MEGAVCPSDSLLNNVGFGEGGCHGRLEEISSRRQYLMGSGLDAPGCLGCAHALQQLLCLWERFSSLQLSQSEANC